MPRPTCFLLDLTDAGRVRWHLTEAVDGRVDRPHGNESKHPTATLFTVASSRRIEPSGGAPCFDSGRKAPPYSRPGADRAALEGAARALRGVVLPSPTAPGPLGGSDSIKDLIRSNPSILEEGLRIVDVDLRAGDAATIDAVGVDRSGGLTIVVLDGADPEAALVRLLDAQIWSIDQRDLLARLYSAHGV